MNPCCEKHDRLDLKLGAAEYTAAECGSQNAGTSKPEFCCFDCPTLKESLNA